MKFGSCINCTVRKEHIPQENLTHRGQNQLELPKEQLKVDLETWQKNEKIKNLASQILSLDSCFKNTPAKKTAKSV